MTIGKNEYKAPLNSMLSIVLPSVSFALMIFTIGLGIELTVFTATVLFIIMPLGSIVLAFVTAKKWNVSLGKTEEIFLRLGSIIAVITIFSFFWINSL
ncbi:MAG: hypothetical protein WCT33_05395 [Patescibacteria group bacterium]|jgi:hypothetical protein